MLGSRKRRTSRDRLTRALDMWLGNRRRSVELSLVKYLRQAKFRLTGALKRHCELREV